MKTAVVIGVGELGALLAEGLLRAGCTVVPVLRSTPIDDVASAHAAPDLVLVAVGEDDLSDVLSSLPNAWRERVALLQNELLPDVWQARAIRAPTVLVVWFEKKRGKLAHELLPSVVFGPSASLLADALSRLGLKSRIAASERDLLRELVVKNLYILTVNIAGLETGGTVRELLRDHRTLAEAVFDDVLALQRARSGADLSRPALLAAFEQAVDADPDHLCTGRSAPARLARALESAAGLGLAVPALQRIASAGGRGTSRP